MEKRAPPRQVSISRWLCFNSGSVVITRLKLSKRYDVKKTKKQNRAWDFVSSKKLLSFNMWSGLKKSILPNIIHEWCISAVNIAKYVPLRESIKILLSIYDRFAILQGLLLLLLKQDTAQTRFNINPIQGGGGTERANVDFNHYFFFQNFNIYKTCRTWRLYLALIFSLIILTSRLSNGYDVTSPRQILYEYFSGFKSSVKSIEHCHCSGQFTEYFQRVVVKLKALIAMLDVQTSPRLDNLIYAYGEKRNRK